MIDLTKRQIRSLLFAATLALSPYVSASSHDLLASDMAAYRSDVVRRVFEAVKNSPEYSRTIIDLNINALGKLTSCRIVKSSGNADLDAAMMKALSQVSLKPMKFAGSSSDSVQIQICFAHPVPDPNNLYLLDNEAFGYKGFGTLIHLDGGMGLSVASPEQVTGGARNNAVPSRFLGVTTVPSRTVARFRSAVAPRPTADGLGARAASSSLAAVDGSHSEGATAGGDKPAVVVSEFSSAARAYDREIGDLLSESLNFFSFDNLRYGLKDAPQSVLSVKSAEDLSEKKHYLAASQAYMMALVEPYRDGNVDELKIVLDKLSKLDPKLTGDERLNVAMSLVNLSERLRSSIPFTSIGNSRDGKVQNAQCINSILAAAQQFVDDSSTKNLARMARFHQKRGTLYQAINNPDKAKLSYQKSLSILLEDENAQTADVERAFDTAINFLVTQDDQDAIKQIESQRSVWETKHPDPTNLHAINTTCKQLENKLRRADAIASGEADQLIERVINLLATSTLLAPGGAANFTSLDDDSTDSQTARNQKNDINRILQDLIRVNDSIAAFARRAGHSPQVEQLLRETYKLALRLQYNQQTRAFQRLADYLSSNGKGEESLALCDLIESRDIDSGALSRRTYKYTIQQVRLRALQELGRTAEYDALNSKLKSDLKIATQTNIERNFSVAERRLASSAPYTSERIQARSLLISSLLARDPVDMPKVKIAYLESMHEMLSDKFPTKSQSDYWDLSNQLTSILTKAEPDLVFTTTAVEGLLRCESRRPSHLMNQDGEVALRRVLPLDQILNNATLVANPKIYQALIRNLIKFCDEQQPAQSEENKLILLRKLASLQSKSGDTEEAAVTNVQIVSLLEKSQKSKGNSEKSELIRALMELAKSEALVGKVPTAKKYEQRAVKLSSGNQQSSKISSQLIELSNIYAKKGALKEASDALLAAIKSAKQSAGSDRAISTHELVHACEERQQFSIAKTFFEAAIETARSDGDNSLTAVNTYRTEFADLLLQEYFADRSKNSLIKEKSPREALLKQSDDVFQVATDSLIQGQGPASKSLGSAVQRRAFVLTLNGMSDKGDALLEKYKEAASNSGGGNLTIDVNVGNPPGSAR